MLLKKIVLGSLLFLLSAISTAQAANNDGLGQTIQITTRFNSFVGKPAWLLIIRDLDHGGVVIPYFFEIKRGENFWVAYTYSRNYVITVSSMRFNPYRWKINNFCNLESKGRIMRGKSIYLTINGNLAPYNNTYTCNVSSYTDTDFTVVNPGES